VAWSLLLPWDVMTRSALSLATLLAMASLATAQDRASVTVDADGEAEMLEAINALRAEEGLQPLQRHEGLDDAALRHSADMAQHRELVHVSERTGDPSARVEEAGVETPRVAENIAKHRSTRGALQSIFDSPPHRAQLLDSGFTHIGLSAVEGPDGIYVTQVLGVVAARVEAQVPALPPPSVTENAPAARNPNAIPPAPAPPQAQQPPQPQQGQQAPPAQQTRVQAPMAQRAQTPTMRVPPRHRRVAGYWLFHGSRWWYFPVPAGAVPGQVIYPDANVQGPPPGYQARSPQRAPQRTIVRQPPQRQPRTTTRTIYWY